MNTYSDDDQMKSSPPPPPATHCRLTPTLPIDDIQPLDLSKKPTEQQPLNLSSKRKRHTPISLSSKRNHSLANSTNPTTLSSMFTPLYGLSTLFDPNQQQELVQQMQTFYSQLQQKIQNETN